MILGVPPGHAVCKVAQRYQMVEQKGENPTWRRQINKRISCFRPRWLFGAAERGYGRICFGGPLPSGPWGWVGLCDCSVGGHHVLSSSTGSLKSVSNNWILGLGRCQAAASFLNLKQLPTHPDLCKNFRNEENAPRYALHALERPFQLTGGRWLAVSTQGLDLSNSQ